jgi:hypothetical protein
MLCDAWLHIGTDPINGAEQKGGQFWRRVFLYFHEHRKFKPDIFESDRNDVSLSKRWSFIQLECKQILWRTREREEPQAKWPWCQ